MRRAVSEESRWRDGEGPRLRRPVWKPRGWGRALSGAWGALVQLEGRWMAQPLGRLL